MPERAAASVSAGHLRFENALRATLDDLSVRPGPIPADLHTQIDGYSALLPTRYRRPFEITELLNVPHVRRSADERCLARTRAARPREVASFAICSVSISTSGE